jgi:hypothetical protein
VSLSADQAVEKAKDLKAVSDAEMPRLDNVRRYWTGRQRLPVVIPPAAPREVRQMARMSRVNFIGLVVESLAQSLAVEGFRAKTDQDNTAVWDIWQRNRFDGRQAALHRAVVAYGVAYGVVTPGEPVPVIRGLSPRRLTALYDDADSDWPVFALERRMKGPWRLYDDELIYELRWTGSTFEYVGQSEHKAGYTPVVRYFEVQDPDWDDEPQARGFLDFGDVLYDRQVIGQVAPLMTIQDQVDLITFNLLVAQHFTAFRQRWIVGWVAPNEQTRMKMGASTVWQFDDKPGDVNLGEFEQTDLSGYLNSRESSFKQASSLTQTPAHELTGDLVNLSAEALAAAEAGRDRKVADRQTTIGESHEQLLELAGKLAGIEVPPDAQVVWRDTGARSFSATVDALGKLSQMLGVPPEELWERVPGVTQQDVERWRARAESGDALTNLAKVLERQGGGATPPAPPPAAAGAAA